MPRMAIAGFFVALAIVPVQAQQARCLERTIPVSVSTSDGSPAPDLTIANLEGTYDKKPITMKAVGPAEKPPRVILLVDASGSMEWRANAIAEAAKRILETLPAQSDVGLAFFQSDFTPVALPTRDRKSLLYQVEALRKSRESFKGRTALRAAVLAAVKMLGTPALGDSIYLISDGEDNRSQAPEDEMERELERSAIRLFVLIIAGEVPPEIGREEFAGPSLLKQAAHNTGGIIVDRAAPPFIESSGTRPNNREIGVEFVKNDGTPTQLGLDLNEQVRQITDFYRVDVALQAAVDKPRVLKLELAGFDKSQLRKLVLAYPSTIFPCR